MSAASRYSAALAAVATALALLLGALALGETASADGGAKSWISIKRLDPGVAKGKVTSGRKSCKSKGRKVSLFRYEGFVSDKIAITYTKRRGKWRVRRSLAPGKYFAKVDHTPACRYAVSKNQWLRG